MDWAAACLDLCLVVEELSRVCSAVAVSYAATALGAYAIILYGSEEQKQKYLPAIASGKNGRFRINRVDCRQRCQRY